MSNILYGFTVDQKGFDDLQGLLIECHALTENKELELTARRFLDRMDKEKQAVEKRKGA